MNPDVEQYIKDNPGLELMISEGEREIAKYFADYTLSYELDFYDHLYLTCFIYVGCTPEEACNQLEKLDEWLFDHPDFMKYDFGYNLGFYA